MPEWLEPMAATLTEERSLGPGWLYERKFDGIRLLAYKRGSKVELFSRNRLPQHLPSSPRRWRNCRSKTPSSTARWRGMAKSSYHVFDILWLNGKKVTDLPLEDRRALLKSLPFTPPLRRVELLNDDDPWDRARREGWEGVIAKRTGSPYEHRRSKQWLKLKVECSQELVVGGFTDPQGARVGLGALLVGRTTKATTSCSPGRSARASTRNSCSICASVSMRSRLPSRPSRKPSACRNCARIGCGRRSSCRCRSSSGRATTSCDIRA